MSDDGKLSAIAETVADAAIILNLGNDEKEREDKPYSYKPLRYKKACKICGRHMYARGMHIHMFRMHPPQTV